MEFKPRFMLFTIGLAVALGSSLTSFYFLYSSILGNKTLVYEANPMLALIEMSFLALSIGTCIIGSEIYYKYLKLKEMIYIDES